MHPSIIAALIGAAVSILVVTIDRLQKYSTRSKEKRATDYDLFIKELQDLIKVKNQELEQYKHRHDANQKVLDAERDRRRLAEDKIDSLEREAIQCKEAVSRLKEAMKLYSVECNMPHISENIDGYNTSDS